MQHVYSTCAREHVFSLTLAPSSCMKVSLSCSLSFVRATLCWATTRVISCLALSPRSSLSMIFWSTCFISPRICFTAASLREKKGKTETWGPTHGSALIVQTVLNMKRPIAALYLWDSFTPYSSKFSSHCLFSSRRPAKAARFEPSCSSVHETSASPFSLCGLHNTHGATKWIHVCEAQRNATILAWAL